MCYNAGTMHYSGLLVISKPGFTRKCTRELARCPGFSVHVADEASGRIVAVLETATIQEQEDGLRHAQRLRHVISAELVCHYFGDASECSPQPFLKENG
jgi:nitrate reductase NapAB chaperone NapD